MRVELVKASPAHVGTIAARMRPCDVAECAAFGRTPKRALRLGLIGSTHVMTAKVDGRAEAMMGLTPINALDGTGCPWMLGTEDIYRHGRLLLTWGPRILSAYRDSTPNLTNVVGAGNDRALRLLRKWGFGVSEETHMIGGLAFLTFSIGE